jgi:hypothetical protein
MSGTLALAGAIARLDRAALTQLVGTRPPAGPTAVQDPIGLAAALLRPDSLSRALAAADREILADLVRLGRGEQLDEQPAATARALGLAGFTGGSTVPLLEVTTALDKALAASGIDRESLLAAPSPAARRQTPALPDLVRGDGWVEPAFTLTQRAAAILRALAQEPGHVRRRGIVAAITVKALALAARTEPASVARILPTLALAGLTAVPEKNALGDAEGSRPLVATDLAADWLTRSHPDRWLDLAAALLSGMPPAVRLLLAEPGTSLAAATGEALQDRFPLATPEVLGAAIEYAEASAEAGFAPHGELSEPASALFAGRVNLALEIVAAAFPAPVVGVYVQPDLSVVAPGPLCPDDERRLLELADLEQLGIAAVFRLSSASLARALDRGWSGTEAREFLEHLSLTGIPQPVAYLLDEVVSRHGSIVVAAHNGDGARSRITAERAELLEAMLVDRTLQHLRLTRLERATKPIALSRLSPEHVAAALANARYPVTMQGSSEGIARSAHVAATAEPLPLAPTLSGHAPLNATLEALVARVSEASTSQPEAGDFVRILELAIRDRTVMDLVVNANGRDWQIRLLPHAVANGRVRGIDPGADVERTLPLTALTSVRSATDPA